MEGDDIATRIADDRFTAGPLRRRKTDLLTRRATDRVELVPITVEDVVRQRIMRDVQARGEAAVVQIVVLTKDEEIGLGYSRPSFLTRLRTRFALWRATR